MLFTRNRLAANALSLAITSVILAAFILATSTSALAHRVNIFAWTEGNEIVAECGFNGGNKVKQGQVVVFDAATGAKLFEGRTDDFGVYRFPVSAEGKAHGVRIVVKAGEGHQNEWTVDAAELATIQPGTGAAPAASSAPASAPAAAAAPAAQAPASPKTDKALPNRRQTSAPQNCKTS